jgi:hypothetical protein
MKTYQMFDWNQDNVIVTGSSDGIVRMWVVEYVKEGDTPKTPVKGKSFMTHVNNSQTTNESNLDVSDKPRPATVVRRLQSIIETDSVIEELCVSEDEVLEDEVT